MVKELDNESFKNVINEESDLIVVDCYANWCGPCKRLAPELEKLSNQYPKISFYKLDVDEYSDIATEYKVSALPTIMFFQKGKKVHEVVGFNVKGIQDFLKKV
jgi:thioredoxin 1